MMHQMGGQEQQVLNLSFNFKGKHPSTLRHSVNNKNEQDLPSPGSQPSLILLGFSLVLEFYFLLNFAACFILLPAKFASCLILLIA